MNKKPLLALLAGGLLAGCGGSSGGSSNAIPPDLLTANWSGTWTQGSPGVYRGTLSVAIAKTAPGVFSVQGTVHDNDRGDGAVDGFLYPKDGTVNITFPFPGSEGFGHESYSGKLSMDDRGHLVGLLRIGGSIGDPTLAIFDLGFVP